MQFCMRIGAAAHPLTCDARSLAQAEKEIEANLLSVATEETTQQATSYVEILKKQAAILYVSSNRVC